MVEADIATGQLLSLLFIAVALGFDSFSLGLGIGMRGIRLLDIAKLGTVIGVFHIIMPIGGMMMGEIVSGLLGDVTHLAAGILLMLLGSHMVYNSFRGEAAPAIDFRSTWGTLVLALSVSVDAFSVGVTLGMFAMNIWITILLFGFFGGVMSMLGLWLGRNVSRKLGEYGEACGGAILVAFGVLFVL